jgi:hypothetical protein
MRSGIRQGTSPVKVFGGHLEKVRLKRVAGLGCNTANDGAGAFATGSSDEVAARDHSVHPRFAAVRQGHQ